jgi:hypothetical protein
LGCVEAVLIRGYAEGDSVMRRKAEIGLIQQMRTRSRAFVQRLWKLGLTSPEATGRIKGPRPP